MIIKAIALCLASNASLAVCHTALAKLRQYQAQEHAAVAALAPAPSLAGAPTSGVAELQAAHQ